MRLRTWAPMAPLACRAIARTGIRSSHAVTNRPSGGSRVLLNPKNGEDSPDATRSRSTQPPRVRAAEDPFDAPLSVVKAQTPRIPQAERSS